MRYLFTAIVLVFILGCSDDSPALIEHGIPGESNPWVNRAPVADEDDFMFAVVSDLYGGYRAGVFDVAVEQLNLLKPEIVMSVGDLIDGGHEDRGQLTSEWDAFDAMAAKLEAPLFRVGGNHDLTNAVMRQVWEERYGRRYYGFVYKNVLFLALDSEDYSEERMQEIYVARGEAIEVMDGPNPERAVDMDYFKMPERRYGQIRDEQSAYFEEMIADNPDVRWTFVFMHKPTYLGPDGGSLSRIETALADRPYTVINGHWHTYSYEKRHDRDYIMLGTTGGSQNAQSEDAFDHLTVIGMTDNGPSIATLKMEGVLNKQGEIPANGSELCFQASKCDLAENE